MDPLWQHQQEDLDASLRMTGAALHWAPRLGKSRVMVHTAETLYAEDRIDAAVIIAPSGVHLNWTREQLPRYWSAGGRFVEWRASRTSVKAYQAELVEALNIDEFVWFSANVEGLGVEKSKLARFLDKLVKRKRCLLIVDESHKIKNPKARRTRAVMRIARSCPYRRCLTGTPTPQGPFDLWAQYHVLDPDLLGRNFTPFKQRHGVWRRVRYGAGPAFDELVEYRNLDDLRRRIAPITFERRKEDCLPWLPERLYARELFELPPSHARAYAELRDDLVTWLEDGEAVTAATALVNLLRLQQVSRGHVTTETGEVRWLDGPYPAADRVVDLVSGNLPNKSVVWCRFVPDVELLCRHLREALGHRAVVRCDGSTPPADRPELIVRYREDPDVKVWVGTLATGGEGIDLGAARLMIFYSHGFDYAQRVQGLERNYGSTQTAERVEVVDLVAADTADARALDVLAAKRDMSERLSVAELRELIRA